MERDTDLAGRILSALKNRDPFEAVDLEEICGEVEEEEGAIRRREFLYHIALLSDAGLIRYFFRSERLADSYARRIQKEGEFAPNSPYTGTDRNGERARNAEIGLCDEWHDVVAIRLTWQGHEWLEAEEPDRVTAWGKI